MYEAMLWILPVSWVLSSRAVLSLCLVVLPCAVVSKVRSAGGGWEIKQKKLQDACWEGHINSGCSREVVLKSTPHLVQQAESW
jgi:hypothetical protein